MDLRLCISVARDARNAASKIIEAKHAGLAMVGRARPSLPLAVLDMCTLLG
jgi:hypothetical protein